MRKTMTGVAPEYSHLTAPEMQIGLEVARVGIGRVDYDRDTVTMDGLSAELFGFTDNEEVSRSDFHARIHADDWPEVEREVDILLAPDKPDVIDLTHRISQPNGEVRWVNARKRVTFGGTGDARKPLTGVFAVVDVTEQKRVEEEMKLLIGELNHRSKNLITVVKGISNLLSRTVSAEAFPEKLNDRLMALTRNQDAMVKGTGAGYSMRDLLRMHVAPFDETVQSQVTVTGPVLHLNAEVAQVVGMVVHELATNAVKYGALSQKDGTVDVSWTAENGRLKELAWSEKGGPPVIAPTSSGFGSKVLNALPKLSLEADVSLSYQEAGLDYRMTLPT